jgi:hypothetical protein
MRMLSSFRAFIAFFILASLSLGIGMITASAANLVADENTACRIPFEKLKDSKSGEPYPLTAAVNENGKLAENLRQRYVVADLNSVDENGNCRGVQEYFAPVDDLSEFPRLRVIAEKRSADIASLAKETANSLAPGSAPEEAAALTQELDDLHNYLEQVARFKTEAVSKPAVFNGYCVGQSLSFCEIVDGQPKLVYRFVTSSSRSPPPLYRYYSPINFINTRNWSSDRNYTPADARRDARMGGGDARIIPFANGGNPIAMPNFMHFLPMPGYPGEPGNGIHEIAGGLDSGGTFGAPVSLGCIRLNKYQAKLARWWIPRQAKFFIYFEPDRYRTYGDQATGKPRGAPVAASYAAATNWTQAPEENYSRRAERPQFPEFPFFRLWSQSDH